jgi:hypothetical protein
MPSNSSVPIAMLAVAALLFTTSIAIADDMGGDPIAVPPPSTTAAADVGPEDPPTDDLCMQVVTYDPERPWRYDTEYIFPLTRHMHCSGLPMAAQVVMYPFAAIIDVFELPVGAIVGLGGE